MWAVSVVAAWWCLFLWTGGAAAAALPRAGFIPWTRPSCFIVSSVCLWRPICPSRRRAYVTCGRTATGTTRALARRHAPVAVRRGCIAGSGKRAVSHTSRTVRVRCGAVGAVGCAAEVPGSRGRASGARGATVAPGGSLTRATRRPSVGPGTERTVPRLPRTAGSKRKAERLSFKAIIKISWNEARNGERPSRRGDRVQHRYRSVTRRQLYGPQTNSTKYAGPLPVRSLPVGSARKRKKRGKRGNPAVRARAGPAGGGSLRVKQVSRAALCTARGTASAHSLTAHSFLSDQPPLVRTRPTSPPWS